MLAGNLVNCLVVLKDSWNWKTNTEMIFLMGRGFFCSRAPKTRVRTLPLTSFLSNQILGTTLIRGRDFKQLLHNILEGRQGVLTLVWVYDTITYLALDLRVIKVKPGQTRSNSSFIYRRRTSVFPIWRWRFGPVNQEDSVSRIFASSYLGSLV